MIRGLLLLSYCLLLVPSAYATRSEIAAFFTEIYDISPEMSKTLEEVRRESFTHRCVNMSWQHRGFGYGQACQADQFGDVSRIDLLYKDYVLDQTLQNESEERILHHKMDQRKNISALILQTVDYVIDRRQPDMSQEERKFFKIAVLAKVVQESYLVHYRTRAKPIKVGGKQVHPMMLLVGDWSPKGKRFRARGMMQINVGAGAHKLPLDVDFDAVKNIAYGVNYFLAMWNKADELKCIKPYKDSYTPGSDTILRYWMRRARLAYSGYNGAGGGMCKTYESVMNKWGLDKMFTAPDPTETDICPSRDEDKSVNAQRCRNYQGYFNRYMSLLQPTAQWYQHSQWNSGFRVNTPVTEILQGDDFGTLTKVMNEDELYEYLTNYYRVYFNEKGEACRANIAKNRVDCIKQENFHLLDCVTSQRGGRLRYGFMSKGIDSLRGSDASIYYPGKNELCVDNSKDLVPVGGFIRISRGYHSDNRPKGINHRAVLGGSGKPEYGSVRTDEIYQVIDFKFKGQKRYYTVKKGKNIGYIFAGSSKSKKSDNYYGKWVQPVRLVELDQESRENIEMIIPVNGMKLKIINEDGLAYFKSEGLDSGKSIEDIQEPAGRLTVGTIITSLGFEVRGEKQEVFVKFEQEGKLYELYAGRSSTKGNTLIKSVQVLP